MACDTPQGLERVRDGAIFVELVDRRMQTVGVWLLQDDVWWPGKAGARVTVTLRGRSTLGGRLLNRFLVFLEITLGSKLVRFDFHEAFNARVFRLVVRWN